MDNPWPQAVADEVQGVLQVHDPRVFQTGRRAFCRSWLDAVLKCPGVRKAHVDLATATARVEFSTGAVAPAQMASAFADAVLEALVSPPDAIPDRGDWVALTAFAGSGSASPWEIQRRSARSLRLRHAGLSENPARRALWLERLSAAEGVNGCRALWFSDGFTLTLDPSRTSESRILDAAHDAWSEVVSPQPVAQTSESLLPLSPWDRIKNLTKAAGAFTLTLVAVAIPGLPTVPFLLATSYYLARSSNRLHNLLLNSSFFGPIVHDWETYRGLSRSSKRRLIGLSVVIIVVTVLLTPTSPIVLALIFLAASVNFYEITQLPGVATDHEPLSATQNLALSTS